MMKFLKMPSILSKVRAKRRFSFVILTWMIIISILPICFLGYIGTVERVNQFNQDAAKIKSDFYDIQTNLIKTEVDAAVRDINFGQEIIHQYYSEMSSTSHKMLEDKLKQDILQRLSKLRFGQEGYAYVNTTDGMALIFDGQLLSKPVDILKSNIPGWKSTYENIRKAVTDDQGKIFKYVFKLHSSNAEGKKVSYVRLYKPWGWLIGAGVYYDEIDKSVNSERAKLWASIKDDIIRYVLIIVFIIFILVIINKIINNSIRLNIVAFKKVFSKSSDDFTKLDVDKIKYEEFRDLAYSANKMIEERNHFFDALRQQHILLRSLIDAVPNLIFYKDKDSRYLGCNHAFAEYMGHDEAEIIGHSDIDLLGTERATAYHESDRLLLESKKLLINEELITYPDGNQKRYETIKTVFNDVHGNVQGIIGISHDITARFEMEEQLTLAKNQAEESNRLKTAFLANMSHEIRTPLNAIIGFSNLLVFDDLTSEEKETYSRLITQSGDSLANLINDIVDMAKIESGQVDVEKESFQVQDVMSDLLIMYRERVFQLELPVIVKYDPDPQYPVLLINSDQFRMKQVIMNLLNNALKFSEKGVVTFGYRVEGLFCYFFVQDQGIGISEESLKVIFDAFTQVDGTYSRQYGGVGLGLSISKRLIELLGGEITVESKPSEGSTFTFSLPLI